MFHFCHSRNTVCLFLARTLQGRSRYMCTGEEKYTTDCVVLQDMELVLKKMIPRSTIKCCTQWRSGRASDSESPQEPLCCVLVQDTLTP